MIILQGPRARLASVPLLFKASACLDDEGLFALGYGKRLAGVFTRAGVKRCVDQAGRLYALPNGAAPLGVVGGNLALLLEQARANLCLQSEDFGTTWAAIGTPTRTAAAHTASGVTLDLLGDDDEGVLEGYSQTIAFTGPAVPKAASAVVRQDTSTSSVIRLREVAPPASDRLLAILTWSGGLPVLTMANGTFLGYKTLTPGVFRLFFTVETVTAENTSSLQVYPATDAALVTTATGRLFVGGAQAEDAAVPSSYIRTGAGPVTRSADALYFPFPLAPTAMTLYVRHIECGTLSIGPGARLISIGLAGINNSVYVIPSATGGAWRISHKTAAGAAVSSTAAAAAAFGDVVETRSVLQSDGAVLIGQALNSGAEAVAATSGVSALGSAWNESRIYVNGDSAGVAAFTHVVVAHGVQSLATMRELAGVG